MIGPFARPFEAELSPDRLATSESPQRSQQLEIKAVFKAQTSMSRVNHNIASLLSRRVIDVKDDSSNEARERRRPDLQINHGENEPVGPTADLRAKSKVQSPKLETGAAYRFEPRTSEFELLAEIARENVMAAERAIRDDEFVVKTSRLTPARILADQCRLLRAGEQTTCCDSPLTSI